MKYTSRKILTSQDILTGSQQSWMWLLQESRAAKASGSMSQRGAKQISMGTPPLYLLMLVLDFDVSIEARDFWILISSLTWTLLALGEFPKFFDSYCLSLQMQIKLYHLCHISAECLYTATDFNHRFMQKQYFPERACCIMTHLLKAQYKVEY